MTVLQLISSSGYYGMENMMVSLATGLSRIGVRPVIGVFEDTREPHTEVADHAENRGLQAIKIPCSGRFDISLVTKLRNLMTTYKIDVLHSHGYKADIYACLALFHRREALIATSHNWPSLRWDMRIYAAIDRCLLKRFDAVAVVSDLVARKLERSGLKRDAIVSIPNGVDVDRFRNAARTLRPDFVIGCVGRAVPAKGGREFLEAARLVLARFPRTRFVWIGDGPSLSTWKECASQLGIASQVDFTGTRNDMPDIYGSLDVVVLPSLEEAMPMCLLEAMAAGRPVIASDVGAVNKVVQSGTTGILVPPGDSSALAAAITRLIADPTLAQRFGAAGNARVTQLFSVETTAQRYAAVYEGALGSRTS